MRALLPGAERVRLHISAFNTAPDCKRLTLTDRSVRRYMKPNTPLVSASGVTPTERWLNVWCIWHTFWKHFRSVKVVIWLVELNRISGRCVFIFGPPGNKDAVAQNPSRKKKAFVFTKCDDEHLSGSTEHCIFKSMWNISSLRHRFFKIHPRISHTGLLLWRHFHIPKRGAKRNKLWLVVWHVGQMASWAGLGQWKRPSIPDLQPSVWSIAFHHLISP